MSYPTDKPRAAFVGLHDGDPLVMAEGGEVAWRVSVFDNDVGVWRSSNQTFPRQRDAEIAAKALLDAGVTNVATMYDLSRKLKADGRTIKMLIAEQYQW